ncbi:MAG: AAA family ATPase, partial [Ghiorsea sp.]|nr:AAA family ATPase [Ghiorsea sp.]
FVDLPSGKEREDILRIHIQKVKRDVSLFDLESLAKASVGFSGAELEEAVTEGMFAAYHEGQELDTIHIEQAIKKTYPLSKTMRESIEKLKAWASVRARFASEKHDEKIPQDSSEMPVLKQEKSNPFI